MVPAPDPTSPPASFPGSVVISTSDPPTWLDLLRKIYQFETTLVAGPGSANREIGACLWDLDQIRKWLGVAPGSAEDLDLQALLERLRSSRQLMRIEYGRESPPKYITRVAETIRILGHTYEYWHRGRPGVDAVRWIVEAKRVPARTIGPAEFSSRATESFVARVPKPPLAEAIRQSMPVGVAAVAAALTSEEEWESARFSEFQLAASIGTLRSQFDPTYRRPVNVLTAGVGSGKTAAFVIPNLVAQIIASRGDLVAPPRTTLLLYPRQALARDQARRLRSVLEHLEEPPLRMWYDHATEYREKFDTSVLQGVTRVYGPHNPHLDFIVLTLDTLKRRLQRPEFVGELCRNQVVSVVLDEVHLASGIQGAHVSLLMSRLKALLGNRRVLWTAASATVALPQVHASRIFGVQHREVEVIRPDEGSMPAEGISHHVFIRPSGAVSTLGVLVNATSLLVHSRRDKMGIRPTGPYSDNNRPKSIGFADSLDMLGRWDADLSENERTEESERRSHPRIPQHAGWNRDQRELPYALRYTRPLDRRLSAVGGRPVEPSDDFGEVLAASTGAGYCVRCKAGERIVIDPGVDVAAMAELQKIAYRGPHKAEDPLKAIRISNPVFSSPGPVGTLDLCPYLRAGACLWFPRDANSGGEFVEQIPGTHATARYEWGDVARSSVYSSKSTQDDDASGGSVAELVFRDTSKRVYDVGNHERIPIDIVLASPSLEVGVDLEMLTESMMTKAIRNIASYRQKAGRVGREFGLDVMNVTLVTDNPTDLHYYRQLHKLVSLGQLDPIPLKDKNQAVIRSAVYSGVWDWLAARANLPEAIPKDVYNNHDTEFTRRLAACHRLIDSKRSELLSHLSTVSRELPPGSPILSAAANQVRDEIGILLADCGDTFEWAGWTGTLRVSDVFIGKLKEEEIRVKINDRKPLDQLDQAVVNYNDKRSNIPPERSDLVDLLARTDRCASSQVWQDSLVSATVGDLRAWRASHPGDPIDDDVRAISEWALPEIQASLRKLSTARVNLTALRATSQFDKLRETAIAKAHYMSNLFQHLTVFASVRQDPWFVRPETLFASPFERSVSILDEHDQVLDSVSTTEALFGFIPGTWTYRLSRGAYKVRSGPADSIAGGRSMLRMDTIVRGGKAAFRRLPDQVTNPLSPGRQLTVYEPEVLHVRPLRWKYVTLDRASKLILDGDEAHTAAESDNEEDLGTTRIKVPKSFLSQWVHASPPRTEAVGIQRPADPEEGRLSVETPAGNRSDPEVIATVRHPLADSALDSVSWCRDLEVSEFVTSVSRSYSGSGASGTELSFRDEYSDVAIGTKYRTEGLQFTLREAELGRAVESIVRGMNSATPAWAASSIRAFRAFILEATRAAGEGLTVFEAGDVLSLVIQSGWPWKSPPSFSTLCRDLQVLSDNANGLATLADEHVRAKRGLLEKDEESTGGELAQAADNAPGADCQPLIDAVHAAARALPAATDYLPKWVRRTILTSFGSTCLSALQKFSGAGDSETGFAVNPEDARPGGQPRITVYDRSTFGNGSTAVGKDYLQLPHVLRHGDTEWSKLLPSEDFLTCIEGELMQCAQFHSDASALVMHATGGGPGVLGLRDVERQAAEFARSSRETWNRVAVGGFADAWRLALVREAASFVARRTGSERDDLMRASTICWNGCPECVGQWESGLGGLEGQGYLDKAVLDAWFESARGSNPAYCVVPTTNLAGSIATLPLGHRQGLYLEVGNRLLRAVTLPWTLGFSLNRSQAPPSLQLLVRTSDLSRLPASRGGGVAVGMSSMALKRLVWFDLLSSAYADLLGQLPSPDTKRIEIASYDLSDLPFDDVGLSPRMLSSVSALAEMDRAPVDLEHLSDLLDWLLRKGFTVRICTDRSKAAVDSRVDRLYRRLATVPGGRVELLVKDLSPQGGLFHSKAIVTPIGAILGSANITEAGGARNDELISYSHVGSPEYGAVQAAVADMLRGAVPWTP